MYSHSQIEENSLPFPQQITGDRERPFEGNLKMRQAPSAFFYMSKWHECETASFKVAIRDFLDVGAASVVVPVEKHRSPEAPPEV